MTTIARSNEQWLSELTTLTEESQSEAWNDLRNYLLRAVLVYLTLHRSELAAWSQQAIHDLAEDLSQEALIEIQHSLQKFRGESKFTTWAYRFIIYRAASELRRHRYRNLSLEHLQEEEPLILQSSKAGREKIDPEQEAARRYYIRLLHEIVDTELNERQRMAIIGVHWQGHSMDEVAAVLKINRNALYKLLFDARKRIKARLRARRLTQGDILAAFEDQW